MDENHESTAQASRDDDDALEPSTDQKQHAYIDSTPPIAPESLFGTSEPGTKVHKEEAAIALSISDLQRRDAGAAKSHTAPVTLRLENFTVYRCGTERKRALEMESLDILLNGADVLVFDGDIVSSRSSFKVRGVKFERLAVDGYFDAAVATVKDRLWIMSTLNAQKGSRLWYRLGSPANRYKRFYQPFLWVANLAKYFVEYVWKHPKAMLRCFAAHFTEWLQAEYKSASALLEWLAQGPGTDVRSSIVANRAFLWKEFSDMRENGIALPCFHDAPLWREIYAESFGSGPDQRETEDFTIVTPFILRCFRQAPFFRHLLKQPPICEQAHHQFALNHLRFRQALRNSYRPAKISGEEVQVGDVVRISREHDSKWRSTHQTWLAYIQGISRQEQGHCSLSVIWLYRPADTPICEVEYPCHDEVFFSDHCNCGDAALSLQDVIETVAIRWAPMKPPSGEDSQLFVRQTYWTTQHAFKTLQKADFACRCKSDADRQDFEIAGRAIRKGDTIYVSQGSHARLQPVIVVELLETEQSVRVRELLRLCMRDGHAQAPVNELIWTDEIRCVRAKHIVGRYQLSFDMHHQGSAQSSPGSACGGHFWFCKRRLDENGKLVELEAIHKLKADPLPSPALTGATKLTGLDLFCGSGNFGRGVESSGPVEMKYAIDISRSAAQTYVSNSPRSEDVDVFCGSCNNYLKAVLSNNDGASWRKRAIDFLLAGSPCQCFSCAQQRRSSTGSARNASLVTSVASYIDYYRPKYALLENVVGMATTYQEFGGTNVFSHLLACFVGMGYQVSTFVLDAWSFGAPQSRTRLFIALSAPGLSPIDHPQLSHAHTANINNISLGKMSNGETFVDRMFGPTPFHFVSAEAATRDLPNIYDGKVKICPSHPDHCVVGNNDRTMVSMISQIPIYPRGSSFRSAIRGGTMSQGLIDIAIKRWRSNARCHEGSKMLTRVDPRGLFRTVMSAPHPTDGHGGVILHWQQHRWLSLLEVRRAQGFPDHEVLIGSRTEQWKLVGNAVSRHVAVALGVVLRDAWTASLKRMEELSELAGEDTHEDLDSFEIAMEWEAFDRNGSGEADTDDEIVTHTVRKRRRLRRVPRVDVEMVESD